MCLNTLLQLSVRGKIDIVLYKLQCMSLIDYYCVHTVTYSNYLVIFYTAYDGYSFDVLTM